MADTAQNATVETEIDFDDAFSRLADLEEGKTPDLTTPAAAAAPEEAPAGEAPAEETPAEEAPAGETPPAADAAPAEKPLEQVKTSPQASDDVLARLARLVSDSQPAQQPAQQQQAEEPPPPYTPEEEAFIANYEKEWPDVAKAELLRRRTEYRQLVGYVFNEVAKELRPVVETLQVLSQRTHLSDLKSTVEDYDTVRDNVIDWVGKQPTYLQVAYNHVIENGTVEEIADLVNRYRRDTGVTAAQPAAAPVAQKKETELPSATKQAAAALAPVSSKRSAVTHTIDPEDFESAFASFASKM